MKRMNSNTYMDSVLTTQQRVVFTSNGSWFHVKVRNVLEDEILNGASYTDGAMIFATDEMKEKVVILKEFRVSAGKYMYMFPAGLIEEGEDIKEAGAREFKEETGLDLEPLYVEKERYVSVGIINEKVNIVYGVFSGIPSSVHQDDNEDAEILIIDKSDASRILEKEEVSIRTAMLLQNFFKYTLSLILDILIY